MNSWRLVVSGGALAAASLIAQPALAQTDSSVINQQSRGLYIGGGLGANFQEDNRFRGPGIDSDTRYDPGFAGILNFGYALGNGLRFEIEPGYRYNHVHGITGSTGAGGHSQIASLMANAIYDIDIHTPFIPLLPHIGVGAGVARIWDREGPHNGLTVDGHDTVPAFQGIVGVDYALTPSMKVGLDYRYFVAHDADFRASNGATARAGDFNDHTVLLTFRYEFGARPRPRPVPAAVTAPPPPPAPVPSAAPAAPPPPAQQAYQVYFALNSAQLTPTARAVVQQAAQRAQQGQVTRITVTGHTDTTGSARYNQRLSVRRADAVKAELVRDGVPADQITTMGQGEENLAVPTADRVNEPRNRRVEIILQSPGS